MYRDVRKLCEAWENKTYQDQFFELVNNHMFSILELHSIINTDFTTSNIFYKNMNGYSVMNLPFNDDVEGQGVIGGISFSSIYHECFDMYDFSPALYLFKVCQILLKEKLSKEENDGWIGRSMRSFASFLRETDYSINLYNKIKEYDAFSLIESGADIDVNEHTDILLTYKRKKYRIWSYQNKDRALENLKKRLISDKSPIPYGIHLLAPIHTQCTDRITNHCGWYFANDNEIDTFCQFIEAINSGNITCTDYEYVKNGLTSIEDNEKDRLKEALGINRAIKKKNLSEHIPQQ